MKTTRNLAIGALLAAAPLLAASPAHADQPPTPLKVYSVGDSAYCSKTPDASWTNRSPVNVEPGTLLQASEKTFSGRGVGGGGESFRFVRAGSEGCYIVDRWVSGPVGDLHVETFQTLALADGLVTLYAAPSTQAPEVGSVSDGDILKTAPRTVKGEFTANGVVAFTPVNASGTLAFAQTATIKPLPTPTYSGSLTLPRRVALRAAPSDSAKVTTDLAKGTEVQTGDPLLGFIPVKTRDATGWIAQSDVIAQPKSVEHKTSNEPRRDPTNSSDDSDFPTGRLPWAAGFLLLGLGAVAAIKKAGSK